MDGCTCLAYTLIYSVCIYVFVVVQVQLPPFLPHPSQSLTRRLHQDSVPHRLLDESLRFSWIRPLLAQLSSQCSSNHGPWLTSEQVREKEDLKGKTPSFYSLILELISAILYSLVGFAQVGRKGITQRNDFRRQGPSNHLLQTRPRMASVFTA